MKEKRVIALAGNPNVGKSTLFNTLTGGKQHTGNWTGKTVETAKGNCESEKYSVELVDLPGTYSLSIHSAEEAVAKEYISGAEHDGVIVVCDAACLERNLILVLQIMELTHNVMVCVNLIDEAEKRGIYIDLNKLSELLGVSVVGTVAKKRKSAEKLLNAIDKLEENKGETAVKDSLNYKGIGQKNELLDNVEAKAIVNAATYIAKQVVIGGENSYSAKDRRMDKIFTGRITAFPVMLMLLAVILWITIVGANYPSQVLSELLLKLQNYLTELFVWLHAPEWLHGVLVLGAYRVSAWVVSVMLPPMAIFFPLFTVLEDSGYLPRIAYNMDKPFQKCSACGKQALTMCMGLGCNAVGVTGCRIIDSPRERLLAVLTNSFMPCNGRFPAIITVITLFCLGNAAGKNEIVSAVLLTLVIALGTIMTFLITWILSKTFMRGITSSFILELPPYRTPQVGKVIVRSIFDRTLFVLGRALTVAVPAGLLLWIMENVSIGNASLLSCCADFIDPFAGILGLDGVILIAFVLGFPANEIVIPIITMAYTAAGTVTELGTESIGKILTENGWSWKTAVCFIIFSLFHWPCATTLMTVKKETGSTKWTVLSAVLPTAAGIICCAMFTAICSLLGI